MEEIILKAKVDLLCKQLRETGSIQVSVSGNSMFPFMKNGDMLLVEPIKIKDVFLGEVVVVYAHNNLYCHRVAFKNPKFIQTKADALVLWDVPANQEDLIGKVVGRVKKGNIIRIDNGWLRIAGILILGFSFLAAPLYIPLRMIKRLFRK
ncbi:MAG: S26 family signal peptidase [Candidatus Omnitrophota bacterium]